MTEHKNTTFSLQAAEQGEIADLARPANLLKVLDVLACGVCHSDRKAFLTPPGGMALPRILGHEIVGILAVDLPDQGLRAGEVVALWPAVSCGKCRFCRTGRENLCPDIKLFGYHFDGGFARELYCEPEYLPHLRCEETAGAISPAIATFCEPLACILNGLRKVQAVPETCLVLGAGFMGRLTARVIKAFWQVPVFFAENDPVRRKLAVADGDICPDDLKADLVLVAASAHEVLDFGLAHLAPGGTMLLFSGMAKGYQMSFPHNELHQREQCLVGVYGCTSEDFSLAMEMLISGNIKVDDLLSQVIELGELPEELARGLISEEFKTVVQL